MAQYLTNHVRPTTLPGASGDLEERLAAGERDARLFQERYRRLMQQIPLGMATVGPAYGFVSVNPAFCDMLGYTADELHNRTLLAVTHPEDISSLAHVPGRVFHPETPDSRQTEVRFIKKDGELLWALSTEMITGDSEASQRMIMVEDRTPFRLETRHLRAAHRRRADIESEERLRISRELHDQTGQRLTAFRMALDQWEMGLPAEEDQVLRQRLRELADAFMADLHRVMHGLQQSAANSGDSDEPLQRYVSRWSEQTGVPTDYYSGNMRHLDLSPAAEQTLFRALQECLTNIHRHASARRVSVTLVHDRDYLTLTVEDDGCGFDPEGIAYRQNGRGLGLAGMHGRVTALDGFLSVESSNDGTAVTVRLPL